MTDWDTITRTRARTPGGGGLITLPGGAQSSLRPDTVRDNRSDYEAREGRMQTGRRTEYAGSKLKPPTTWEGAAVVGCDPRTGGPFRWCAPGAGQVEASDLTV